MAILYPVPRKLDVSRIAAVILDVDGTMYDQARVRRAMLWRIVRAHVSRPRDFVRTARIVMAYRRAQEELRGDVVCGDLAAAQDRYAAARSGVGEAEVRAITNRWMDKEACDAVAGAMRPGLRAFLEAARSRGWRLGVVSDYPAASKLKAMDIAHLFDVVVTAQDPLVQRFKPDPRGIELALSRLAVSHEEALFVGDREDIDAQAAARAGIACVLVGQSRAAKPHIVAGFEELQRVLLA